MDKIIFTCERTKRDFSFNISIAVAGNDVQISQISPKSGEVIISEDLLTNIVQSSQKIHFDSQPSTTDKSAIETTQSESAKQRLHRIERSASPILNDDRASRSAFSDDVVTIDKLQHIDNNEVNEAAARKLTDGRYFNYIQPTSTSSKLSIESAEITRSERMAKELSSDPFLSKRGPRTDTSARSPAAAAAPMISVDSTNTTINPTTATQMSANVMPTPLIHHGRQNPNPDIQDIITGIVKLLNGNVNVHANTQPQIQASRRPYPTRINNRGPPRISEAQPLPNEYEQLPPTSTMRPPPYPFDRPDGPIRPFINGVPLPEQIVPPSMQQNFNRPGFISQNRPPWQRPRPRPPITGNRRPIPPYQPVQSMPEYRPENDVQLTTLEIDQTNATDDANPTDSNFDLSAYEVEQEEVVDDQIELTTTSNELVQPATATPVTTATVTKTAAKKEDFSKKKDKQKSSDKKPVIPVTPTSTEIISPSTAPIEQQSTVIVVNNSQYVPTTEVAVTNVETSIDDISAGTTTALSSSSEPTPSLTTTTKLEFTRPQQPYTQSGPPTVAATTHSPIVDTNLPYHPRPGIVLDDPEFKPGGGYRRPPPQQQQHQIQPTRPVTPPGYGEIFDVTLSAIQGPSGSGSKQTIKIKPYDGGGSYSGGGSGPGGDIIVSPSGDEGFVSIDGKRTYLNLFGDSSETDLLPSSSATVQPHITTSSVAALPPTPAGPIRSGTHQVVRD